MIPPTPERITGLVLAGGLGRRMGGVDKGLSLLDGEPLVEHIIRRLAPQVGRLIINANQNHDTYAGFGYPVVGDRITGYAGPLAGFLAGAERPERGHLSVVLLPREARADEAALETALLTPLLPFLLIGLAIYVLLSPRLGDGDSRRRLGIRAFAFSAGLGIGFYDGCFGPGTGSFFAIAFVTLAGFNLAKATAHSKLLNFTSNLAALIGFALGGKVLWSVGLCMAAGQFVGARLGARVVIRQGSQLIRPLVVLVSLLMSAKLLWSHWL